MKNIEKWEISLKKLKIRKKKKKKNENIVVCLNESEKKGRLYELTPKGKETYKYILKNMEQN